MRYLVTGCCGFIGSTLTDRLLSEGHEIVGIDCFSDYYDPAIKQRNIADARDHENFTLIEADLATVDLGQYVDGIDGVFHFAAQAGVRASWGSEFETYTSANVNSTQRLLEALVSHYGEGNAPRVVYSSSSSIYGNAEGRPTREDAIPAPVSPYGVTKLAAEHLCDTYHHNFGVPALSLRYFTVFGERQRPDMAFHKFLRRAYDGTEISIYGDGRQSRDFTYVKDAVNANVLAMNCEANTGAYNIGGGGIITVREALEVIENVTGCELRVNYTERQKGDVRHTSADTTRARETLGFEPTADFAEALGAEARWIRQLYAGV